MNILKPFKSGFEEIKRWLELQLDLLKVGGTKKAVEIASKVTFSLLTLLFFLLGFSFLSIALSLWIGELLNSYALGFLIVGAIPIVIVLILVIFKKAVFKFLLNFFTRIITK